MSEYASVVLCRLSDIKKRQVRLSNLLWNLLSRPKESEADPMTLYLRQRQSSNRRILIQGLLFVLTVISTTLVGGFAYSACLILILLCHEMGHYFAARHYGVPATLPYFIPFPLSPFGTFGAVIRMQGIIPNRKALFDIGILGPAMGVVVALPATIVGIAMSKVVQTAELGESTISLGDSILFSILSRWIHGPLPDGKDILLHPIGFAGWAGLFVTALNLLPMGQLDGGHIVHALFYKKSTTVYRIVFALFAAFAVWHHMQWLFFLALVFFLVKLKHPPTLDDERPIGPKRFAFGIAALIFFAITFPPVPMKIGP
jgi:membrane-associated protease RseP (regulator of RpoE activity)